jgi:hypothetical protein
VDQEVALGVPLGELDDDLDDEADADADADAETDGVGELGDGELGDGLGELGDGDGLLVVGVGIGDGFFVGGACLPLTAGTTRVAPYSWPKPTGTTCTGMP